MEGTPSKDPSNEAIEEQEGDDLRNTVENADAVAVFICKSGTNKPHWMLISFWLDSHDSCDNCLAVLTELENIDDDVGKQKISMVKTTDAAFAEEIGLEEFPALVFFKVIKNHSSQFGVH